MVLILLIRAYLYLFFFFQAEDGIRDYKVTGVQTCALPISRGGELRRRPHHREVRGGRARRRAAVRARWSSRRQRAAAGPGRDRGLPGREIGRASCRERV